MAKVYVIATNNPNIIGGGTHDDTEGFQEILDIAKTEGSVRILVPPLKFRLTDSLYFHRNTTFICSEGTEFVKDHDGLLFTNNNPSETYSGYAGHGRIKVVGGIWDCQAPNRSGGTPFPLIHAEGLTFRDMIIKDCNNGHAFEFNACKGIELDHCRFEGFYGDQLYEEAIQLDLAKPPGGVAPWFAGEWDNTPCQDVTIKHCYFGPSETNESWGRAVGSHSATIGAQHKGVRILHNDFDKLKSWAVKTYNYENVTIDDNRCYHCRGGISIDPPDPSDTADTINTNGVQTNGSQTCTDIAVTNNKFYGSDSNSWSAISAGGYSSGKLRNVNISGNMMNGSKGIYGNYLDVATIGLNTFHNVDVEPIIINNSSRVVRSGNNY